MVALIYTSQVVNAVLLPLHVIALQLLASDASITGANPPRSRLAGGRLGQHRADPRLRGSTGVELDQRVVSEKIMGRSGVIP